MEVSDVNLAKWIVGNSMVLSSQPPSVFWSRTEVSYQEKDFFCISNLPASLVWRKRSAFFLTFIFWLSSVRSTNNDSVFLKSLHNNFFSF